MQCWCYAIAAILLLDLTLVPVLKESGQADVPYGGAMPIPLFYCGILGGALIYGRECLTKNQRFRAAAAAILCSAGYAVINYQFWFGGGYPPTHYSKIIPYAPTVLASLAMLIFGVSLCLSRRN